MQVNQATTSSITHSTKPAPCLIISINYCANTLLKISLSKTYTARLIDLSILIRDLLQLLPTQSTDCFPTWKGSYVLPSVNALQDSTFKALLTAVLDRLTTHLYKDTQTWKPWLALTCYTTYLCYHVCWVLGSSFAASIPVLTHLCIFSHQAYHLLHGKYNSTFSTNYSWSCWSQLYVYNQKKIMRI